MRGTFSDHELAQFDKAAHKRVAAADWHDSKPTKRCLQDLSACASVPFALPDGAPEAPQVPEHYAAWITLNNGDVRRHPVGLCSTEDEALEQAQAVASSLYGARVSSISVMARGE
jgi:hypothetical protein